MRAEEGKLGLGWKRIAVCVLLLLLAGISGLFLRHITNMLPSQQAAERWGGANAGRFAQVTVFLPEYGGLTPHLVNGFMSSVFGELTLQGLAPHTPAGAPVHAYSAEGMLQVASRSRGPIDVYVTGVGGNFFLFHPVQLISGASLPTESMNRDLVVIDETLAWRLFGATNVAGMDVMINGAPYVISGVYRTLDNFASRAAYGDMPHMFLFYDALADIRGSVPITTLEVVLPNPLTGMAETIVREALDAVNVDEDGFRLVNNTGRYRFLPLLGVARDFGERSMYRTGLRLPHWENAARMVEDFAAMALVLLLILLLYPTIVIVQFGYRRWRVRKWRIALARKKLEEIKERRRAATWEDTRALQGEEENQYHVDEIIREIKESEDDEK